MTTEHPEVQPLERVCRRSRRTLGRRSAAGDRLPGGRRHQPAYLAAALGMSSNLLAHHLKGARGERAWCAGSHRSPMVDAPMCAWFRRRWRLPAGSRPPPSRRHGSCSSARATPRARSWPPRSGPIAQDAQPPPRGRAPPPGSTRAPCGRPGRRPGLRLLADRPAATAEVLDPPGRDHHGVRLSRSRGPGGSHPLVDPGPGPGRHDGRLRAHPGRSHEPDRRLGGRRPRTARADGPTPRVPWRSGGGDLADQDLDAPADLVPDRPHAFDRLARGVVELPSPGNASRVDRARVAAAHRDHDVGGRAPLRR